MCCFGSFEWRECTTNNSERKCDRKTNVVFCWCFGREGFLLSYSRRTAAVCFGPVCVSHTYPVRQACECFCASVSRYSCVPNTPTAAKMVLTCFWPLSVCGTDAWWNVPLTSCQWGGSPPIDTNNLTRSSSCAPPPVGWQLTVSEPDTVSIIIITDSFDCNKGTFEVCLRANHSRYECILNGPIRCDGGRS